MMRRNGPNLLRWISLGLLLVAVVLTFYELIVYSRRRAHLPDRLTIAGVPVGGLDPSSALQRLHQVYDTPIEGHYGEQTVFINPASVGFRLDTEVMLAAAENARTGIDFWAGFWNFLWSRPGEEIQIPLRAEHSQSQLRNTLLDIAARYDNPPIPAQPIPGTPNFEPGVPGTLLDVDRSQELVAEILRSPHDRSVNLPVVGDASPRPSMDTLEVLLKQNIDVAGFEGLSDLFILNLQTGDEIHFLYQDGEDLPIQDDVAFTAASIIKIGIMVSYYRYFDEPLSEEADEQMIDMVTRSGNESSDWLMQQIDENLGPIMVTETLQELGYENTFMAGYFYLGAPLLRNFGTPANTRADIDTDPDVYTQTTPSEIGSILADIYACAKGGGTLRAVFPEEVSADECNLMLNLLSENKIGVLIEGGVPEGTRVAHKHGWPSSPFDMIGDAGIVFSPNGDYIVSIFLANKPEMIWEPTSELVAELSRATYNYFNPPVE
jgi:beta-lactamase class A